MSSAILYLAIVAIWAGVLIPRWLKRDTSSAKKSKLSREVPAGAAAESGGAGVQMADESGRDRARDELDDDQADDDGDDYEPELRPAGPEARSRVLTARRRMLMILVGLTAVALGIVVIGMAAWWVAAPPAAMLGGYLLLLREARRADAERAQSLAEAAAAYRAEDERRRAEAEAAGLAEAPRTSEQPRMAEVPRTAEAPRTARIIDISERVRDELYDQYADAERRAVGD